MECLRQASWCMELSLDRSGLFGVWPIVLELAQGAKQVCTANNDIE